MAMEYGKYIIKLMSGDREVAILFDAEINHIDIGTCKDSRGITVAAGMFVVAAEPSDEDPDDISVGVLGESVTLKMGIRKGKDEELIKKILRKKWM